MERLVGGVVDEFSAHMDRLEFDEGLEAYWRVVQAANRYIEEKKPWELAKKGDPESLGAVLRVLLEVLRVSSILCAPFMPAKSVEMRKLLRLESDVSKIRLDEARRPGDPVWQEVGAPVALFPRIEDEKE